MKSQIAALKEEINQAYKAYNKTPYHLHAIVVHDGGADEGHYFTFIKDHFNKKWIKLNDIKVNDITEEEVF